MNHDEFTCHSCGTRGHITQLRKRETMLGDFCKECAKLEKCGLCGEMCEAKDMKMKHGQLVCECSEVELELNQ